MSNNIRNTGNRVGNPISKVMAALYAEEPVEHNGWLIRINAHDMIEVFPPDASPEPAFEAPLADLTNVVTAFCKKAGMPIPSVNKYPKDQVNVGTPSKLLGEDSSEGEGFTNPKVNTRPDNGSKGKGITLPNTSLGKDTSGKDVGHFSPAINRRPKDPVGRGGLPLTDLGPDSSRNETHWRDKKVKIQPDGRTGRRQADEFDVTVQEEPGKHLNEGENPSDIGEFIQNDQETETEGKKKSRFLDTFRDAQPDASEIYRKMTASRPSEQMLQDIMNPDKWIANNRFAKARQSQMYQSNSPEPKGDAMVPSEEPFQAEDLLPGQQPLPMDVPPGREGDFTVVAEEGEVAACSGKSGRKARRVVAKARVAAFITRKRLARKLSRRAKSAGLPHYEVKVNGKPAHRGTLKDENKALELFNEKSLGSMDDSQGFGESLVELWLDGELIDSTDWDASESRAQADEYGDFEDMDFADRNSEEADLEQLLSPRFHQMKQSQMQDEMIDPPQGGGWDNNIADLANFTMGQHDPVHKVMVAWLNGKPIEKSILEDAILGLSDLEEVYQLSNDTVMRSLSRDLSSCLDIMEGQLQSGGAKGQFTITVSNLGILWEGDDEAQAYAEYEDYCDQILQKDIVVQNQYGKLVSPTVTLSLGGQTLEESEVPVAGAEDEGGDDEEAFRSAGVKQAAGGRGVRIQENWDQDGVYGRNLEAESPAELHALVRALGGEQIDEWPTSTPSMPEGQQTDLAGSSDGVKANVHEAVDESAKQYWGGYFDQGGTGYGRDMTRDNLGKEIKNKKKQDNRPEKTTRAIPKESQAAPGGAPTPAPTAPPAQGGAPVPGTSPAPPAPGAAPIPGGAPAPKGPPGGIPAGTGDAGLQSLGWTTEEISLMDESDKKKILEIQLAKPGTRKKPPTPGGAPAPGAAPAAPGQKPPAGPAMPGETPPAAPQPGTAAASRVAEIMQRKLNMRRVLRAQAQPTPSAPPAAEVPGQIPPSKGLPAQKDIAPKAPSSPGGNVPPAPSAKGEPSPAGQAPASDGKDKGKSSPVETSGTDDALAEQAFTLLAEVQQMPVTSTTSEQVSSIKSAELARRLLSELGIPLSEARGLFGLSKDKSIASLFE